MSTKNESMSELQRLQKMLAHLGVASRRHAEVLIQSGRVRLNGEVVTQLGTKVDPIHDQIELDGTILLAGQDSAKPPAQSIQEPIPFPPRHTLLLHKPKGVLSTCFDPQGRPTVLDLLPSDWRSIRLYPVGRLDAESTGALLLTNDGDLALRLTHPRYHLPKTYRVEVQGQPAAATLQRWRDGVDLEESPTLPAQVDIRSEGFLSQEAAISPDNAKIRAKRNRHHGDRPSSTILTIVLREGRKRQIRRVAEQLGHPVIALHREAIGSIQLGSLTVGQFRLLSAAEICTLMCESQADHVS